MSTDAKILYAHYCAGRFPDAVSVDLPDLHDAHAALIAELCVARALGAYDREHHPELLPTAPQVAAMVSEMLDDEETPEPDAAPAAPTAGPIGVSKGTRREDGSIDTKHYGPAGGAQ